MRHVFLPLAFLLFSCASQLNELVPPPLSLTLPQECPCLTYSTSTRKRRNKRKSVPRTPKSMLPAVINVTGAQKDLRSILIYTAGLLIGVRGEFKKRPFICYVLYASDLTRRRNCSDRDVFFITRPKLLPEPGDLILLSGCNRSGSWGVVSDICAKGLAVVTNCRGRVELVLVPHKTLKHNSCKSIEILKKVKVIRVRGVR